MEGSDAVNINKYVSGVSASGEAQAAAGGNQPVIAKLLVSNSSAGSVIGKAGASIEQLQRSSGARLQLSRTGEFFPGTSDRVLLLSGSLHAVLTAIFLILEKVTKDQAAAATAARARGQYRERDENPGDNIVKLALSRKLCGVLIGTKGATVRDFIADSGSTIRVQPLAELTPSDPERIVAVSGARDQVLRAVALILNTLSLDDVFGGYMESTLLIASTQGVVLPPRSGSTRSALAGVRAALSLYLPDDDVGAVLGRKGQNLVEIQQTSRAQIKISDRKEMDPELKEREVTVSGTYAAVKLAEAMVAEKLQQQLRLRAGRDGGGGGGGDEQQDSEQRPRRGGGRPGYNGGERRSGGGRGGGGDRRSRAPALAPAPAAEVEGGEA